MTTRLSAANLEDIAKRAAVPAYDRAGLSAGIMHFGAGNFHRAHQGVYLDDVFNLGRDHDWAILGAGVMASDEGLRQTLAAQDFLTTVVEQDAERSTARVTGAMVGHLPVGDVDATVARLADPAIRIVSMTITEGGYFIDPASGAFDPTLPGIAADGASPDKPKTVFGLIAAGLKRRRAAGLAPFTVMSCDNIPHNGVVARNAVAGLAGLWEAGLADWIGKNVAFPNAMVDRITPATGARERRILAEQYGIEDAWPVFCEGFRQWVLEDNFPAGRPALEEAGVQFVADVTAYENMKIRILNGGHAVIAYPAGLLDIEFVHDAMRHPLIAAFLEKVTREEIIPVVPFVPDTSLDDYYRLIVRRFSNPKIGDTVRRLCLDGSNRQPKFIVPSITDRLQAGAGISGLGLESALWCRYCFGVTDAGRAIEPNDPNWGRLQRQSQDARHDPLHWLAMGDIYGEVARAEPFHQAFSHWLAALWDHGTAATLERYLAQG